MQNSKCKILGLRCVFSILGVEIPTFSYPIWGVLHIFGAKWSKTRPEGFQISTYCPIFVVYYKTSKNGRQ